MNDRPVPRDPGAPHRNGARRCPLAATLAALTAAAALAAPPPAAPPAPTPGDAEPRAVQAQLLALADARRFEPEAFAKLVADRLPDGRAAAVRVLGELPDPRAAALVARLAHDPDARVRAEAAAAAGRLAATLPAGSHEIAALAGEVHRLLGDPAPPVRAAAAWAAGAARPPEGDLWLLQRLGREKDPATLAAALRELWRFPGTLWIKRATTFVTAPDAGVRLAAVWSLARSGRPEAAAGLKRASRDADAVVRMTALEGARRGKAKALLPELFAGAADADARVRIAALAGIESALRQEPGLTVPPALVERVQRTIADADPDRVHERVVAIRLAGAAKCCEAQLEAALAGGEAWVAGEALAAHAQSGAAGSDHLVGEWFASPEPARRVAAVKALKSVNRGQQQLVAALGDPHAAVRLAAIDALGDDAGAAAVSALGQRVSDSDPAVRAAAVGALAQRKKLPPPEELLRLLARERDATASDAAVALVDGLGEGKTLPDGAIAALDGLLSSPDPVRARAAWRVLAAHGVARPFPEVKTAEPPEFYRKVVDWAAAKRWVQIITARGTMQVVLDTAQAPLTCFRLAELAEKKFFDGLTIHRVEPDFVVQGGDPRGDGWGGPGFALRDELSLAPFGAGSVGIALDGPDTGGSQFFATLTPRPHLNGRYAHIGTLAAGLEVAQRLRVGDRIVRVRSGEGAPPAYFPVWYGWLDPARLDREIAGWREEREKDVPQAKWLDLLRTAKLRYQIIVAMGTWCSDSHEQVPRLQAVLAALGSASPFEPPRLLGIDRSKSVDAKAFPFGPVELVPTIVVLAGGAEIGRIVETPKSGSIEEELARILAPVEGWQLPDA